MFKCEFCRKDTGPGIRSTTIVTERRPKAYINIHKNLSPTEEDPDEFFEVQTEGWEIVKEVRACPSCAEIEGKAENTCY